MCNGVFAWSRIAVRDLWKGLKSGGIISLLATLKLCLPRMLRQPSRESKLNTPTGSILEYAEAEEGSCGHWIPAVLFTLLNEETLVV